MRDAAASGRLTGLPEDTSPATAVIDARGVVIGWSAQAERLLGYPYPEAVGRRAVALLGSDSVALTPQPHSTAVGPSARAWLRHRDGHRLEAWLLVHPSLDVDGRPQGLVVATPVDRTDWPAHDDDGITDAFVQCVLPVAICDSNLRALRVSDGMVGESGLSEQQIRGRRPTDLLPGPVGDQLEQGMLRALETGQPEHLRVHTALRAGLRDQVWSVTLSPLEDPAGQVRRVQLTAVDVTQQYRAHERLALMNKISAQVGTTLDVTRTAQEMADAAVAALADFVSVDLLDSLLGGVEPQLSGGSVALRRVAHQSVLPGVPESVINIGDVDDYPSSSPPARCLATGRSSLHRTLDQAIGAWKAGDPERAAAVSTHGMHSIIVIPLNARGITIGVAVLVRHRRPDPFDEDDLLLAEEIGARAAVAVDNARRYTRERTTALALQRSLLPQRLSGRQAVQTACRYLPADTRAGVGGDWFDVIPLSGARVALVVGDVVGHGLRASATMGRLRTAVRTLADVDLPPDELLTHLDDLVTHLASDQGDTTGQALDMVTDLVATCLYLVYDPISQRCAAACAGHPPPAVVTPDGHVSFLDVPVGPPLGLGGLPFEATDRQLEPGSLLALYTNGLLRTPERDLGQGLAGLRRALTHPAASLEALCDTLLQDLLPELSQRPDDDVALLVARTQALDAGQVATWELPSDPAAVAETRAAASRQAVAWGMTDDVFTVELVVSELVTNAIRYGAPPVQLRLIHDGALICEVSDSSSTAPHLRRARTFDEGGRGLLLVAQFTRRWGTRHSRVGKTIWAEIALESV
ncbi:MULTISPECIES: SpoIIE family protein phosphatase [unclassified Kitasatospora]|uniref:SpoIIE family protein phosphatase n=1 Tax=unclassified Kitasatospora TaxID=2633591 RepID=UPI0033E77351